MDEDPFTCFTRRRIDVRKQSKPSILTITFDSDHPLWHISFCYYIPAILNSHSGASTIKTLFQRRSDGSVLGTYYDEPRPTQKVGKVENIFCFSWRNSRDIGILCTEVYIHVPGMNYWDLLWILYVIFALVKILQLFFKEVYCYAYLGRDTTH